MRITRTWLQAAVLLTILASTAPFLHSEDNGQFSEAQTFLDGVLKHYANAKSFHIELVEESQLSGDLRRTWEKHRLTSLMLSDKRYRFEAETDQGRVVQLSDGISTWLYLSQLGQYSQEPVSESVPAPLPRVGVSGLNPLLDARRVLARFSSPRGWIRSATYLADESLEVNGHTVLCTVVQAKGILQGAGTGNHEIKTVLTFWIEKHHDTIWKETETRQGPLFPDLPDVDYTLQRTTSFKHSDPDAKTAPADFFLFTPPRGAQLVKGLATVRQLTARSIQGLPVPQVKLTTADGKALPLESFRGKPLLLDFWATWCVPCVESLPALRRLYDETADKGLVLIAIDNDEDEHTATDFLGKLKEPWRNFHLTPDIAAAFPEHGIPYLVLIDGDGKVVYSVEGLDEAGLRTAVANLGPDFARLAKAVQ